MKKQLIFDGEVYDLVLVRNKTVAEWKPRKGELCEFWDGNPRNPRIDYFQQMSTGQPYIFAATHDTWKHCRPIQDPNLIQMIPHDGGECPVPGDTKVLVKIRDGAMWDSRAKNLRWRHADLGRDIVKYAVLK